MDPLKSLGVARSMLSHDFFRVMDMSSQAHRQMVLRRFPPSTELDLNNTTKVNLRGWQYLIIPSNSTLTLSLQIKYLGEIPLRIFQPIQRL
jgi:hypothetical protein